MNLLIKHSPIFFVLMVLFASCKKDQSIGEPVIQEGTSGKIEIQFVHSIGANPLFLNNNQYINEAGNHIEINELMYFISDVRLHLHNGTTKFINQQTAVHYVDLSLPNTLTWNVVDPISQGAVDSVTFTFGLSPDRNKSFAFVNPPESNMAWPDILGGGYHYMMLNGKWIDQNQIEQFFNFHMGIGQVYTDTINFNTNTISEYVHNDFDVTLATPNLNIQANKTAKLYINMDILSWLKTPNTWDFNYWGGGIMQNQRALKTAKENGFDVFTISNTSGKSFVYDNTSWMNSSQDHFKPMLYCKFTRSLEKKTKSCCNGKR